MARSRFCKVCDDWHPLEAWPHRAVRPLRSGLPAPMIICDHMDAVQSMASGKWYESKSALRAEYRERGVIELGNDAPTTAPEPQTRGVVTRDDVAEAVAMVKAGYKPQIDSVPIDIPEGNSGWVDYSA